MKRNIHNLLSSFDFYISLYLILCCMSCSTIAEEYKYINSYEECVAAKNIILKTYPPVCITKDGQRFKKEITAKKPESEVLCKDRCGDGFCNEIVCMGEDCPCAENTSSCAKDCRDRS